jgi:hypothetical protein
MSRARTSVLTLAILSAGVLTVAGCATPTKMEPTFETAAQNRFIPTNQAAAAALLGQLKGRLQADQPIIMATLVDINVLERSSTMGRMVSEQVSAVFSQASYRMIEMKFRDSVYMKRNEGELLLTREITEVAKQHNAQAVIVGTYGTASDTIFINLKVVQPGSNLVLAAHDYALPMDNNIRAMLSTPR